VSLKSRLRRLEEHRRSGRCDGCGLTPSESGYIVLINEGRSEESFEGDPDERCPECGRYLYFVVRVVYDSPADGAEDAYHWP
jgi:hypothetical protein